MSLFKEQEVYCNNCGKLFIGQPVKNVGMSGGIVCSSECREEFNLKYACFVMGKEYKKEIKNAS